MSTFPLPAATASPDSSNLAPVEETLDTRVSNLDRAEHSDNGCKRHTEDVMATRTQRRVPEPLQTASTPSSKAERQQFPLTPPLTSPEATSSGQATPSTITPRARTRKFKPQLIESSRRSKKAGVEGPALRPADKTDITPGTNHIYVERRRPSASTRPGPPENTPRESFTDLRNLDPLYHQGAMTPNHDVGVKTRWESYHPALEPIMSGSTTENEDGTDSMPSLSASLVSSADSSHKTHLFRSRSSCDERFSGYLLALAAKTAEKQLKDQTLAAFPNEYTHETVEHFYTHHSSPSSSPKRHIGHLRRGSTGEGWAAKEMQVHQEKLERLRAEAQRKENEANRKLAEEATSDLEDPFWSNGVTDRMAMFARGSPEVIDLAKEEELERRRKAASPPMLGGDLVFRTCPSPKRTKFESDQKFDVAPFQSETGGGLWGGYCVAEQEGEYLSPGLKGRQGLIRTPLHESPLPSGQTSPTLNRTPTKQRSGIHLLAGLDERLEIEATKKKEEERIQEEFSDAFVTQVYNYLTLGYPSMARRFDAELARISKVDVEDLRADDKHASGAGYIDLVSADQLPMVLGEDEGNDTRIEAVKGARWKALRLYILEWARQHPGGLGEDAVGGWGVRERRGSWAI